MIGIMVAAAAQQAAPVPPPMPQVTADCTRPVYATDMLVCADPALKALDQRVRSMLSTEPLPVAISASSPLIEPQEVWFTRSRRCAFKPAHRACVEAAYLKRIAVLSASSDGGAGAGTCRLDDGRDAEVVVTPGGFLLRRSGQMLTLALPPSREWRPFVTYASHGRRSVLTKLDGETAATCRLQAGDRRE